MLKKLAKIPIFFLFGQNFFLKVPDFLTRARIGASPPFSPPPQSPMCGCMYGLIFHIAIGIVHSDGTFYMATSRLDQGVGRRNF